MISSIYQLFCPTFSVALSGFPTVNNHAALDGMKSIWLTFQNNVFVFTKVSSSSLVT